MRILSFETSCDETSAAVVDGTDVLSCSISSSARDFCNTGGVIPEDAARKQLECILPVLHEALAKADTEIEKIDAIAVTVKPGLKGSLLIGTVTARMLSSMYTKRLIEVDHIYGHLCSTWIDSEKQDTAPEFPCLTLSLSGGHSDVWLRTSHTEAELLGSTRDDAIGEAFDKGASMLGLPYPGGPAVSKLAAEGNRSAIAFPKPLQGKDTLDFSFSGLKTALRYYLRDNPNTPHADVAASYEHALCMHIVDRVQKASEQNPSIKQIHIVGGVSANRHLRHLLSETSLPVLWPTQMRYCTDNAAMIGVAAYFLEGNSL